MNLDTTIMKEGIDLRSLFADAQIPALPTTAMRLLELSKQPQAGLDDYSQSIVTDPSLSCQILRFANSSYFGFSREISSIKQALVLLGVRPIRNFALWSAVYSLVPNPTFGSFDLKSLWQDSLRRAVFARTVAKSIQLPNAEEIFAAALLQDVAIPIFLKLIASTYEPLIAESAKQEKRLSELERERFGWDHSDASALLCRNWHLPEEIAGLVEQHTNLHCLFSNTVPQFDASCVAISALLPSAKVDVWFEREQFQHAFEHLTIGCGLDGSKIVQESDASFTEFAPVLNLPGNSRSISEWLLGDAK